MSLIRLPLFWGKRLAPGRGGGNWHMASMRHASRLDLRFPASSIRVHELRSRAQLMAMRIVQCRNPAQLRTQHDFQAGPFVSDVETIHRMDEANRSIIAHHECASGRPTDHG